MWWTMFLAPVFTRKILGTVYDSRTEKATVTRKNNSKKFHVGIIQAQYNVVSLTPYKVHF